MVRILRAIALTAVGAAAIGATPALAQEEEASGPLDISANIGLYSDYRFRGVSLNEEDIAIQGGVDLSYAVSDNVSLYVGNWNSTLEDDVGYGDTEVDLYGGITGSAGNVGWKLGGIAYLYPDASGVDYYELQAEVNGEVGPATLAAGVFIAPSQSNFGSKTGKYFYTNASYGIPDTPITLKATLGHEDNAFFNNKLDWSLGASFGWKVFTFGVAYIDSNRTALYAEGAKIFDASDGTFVFNLTAAF
jgi:uncharacterized protein (TIGR02001 family)